jgi:hypothetical protein
VGKLGRIQDSNSNARPRLESEPGAPYAFFGFVVVGAKRAVIEDKEKPKAGKGNVLSGI